MSWCAHVGCIENAVAYEQCLMDVIEQIAALKAEAADRQDVVLDDVFGGGVIP